jgi:hypothetical protein
MRYLEFLDGVHERLNPPTYLEIGVRHGDSLALARKWAIGVDPRPRLKVELSEQTRMYKQTSDAYFERDRPLRHFRRHRVALSFIDGLHHSEFALRDFINVERLSRWTTAVVFDDVFPESAEMAARERETRAWTGDVYKVMGVLERERPDLVQVRVDTEPTGLLLVLGLDPDDRTLAARYDELVGELVTPDPQDVPTDVLERHGALDPQAVLDGSFWEVLRANRGKPVKREDGVKALKKALRQDFGKALTGVGRSSLLPWRA